MLDKYPDVLDVKQLCEILHIGKNLAYSLLQNGDIKSIVIGRSYKIPKRFVLDYLNI